MKTVSWATAAAAPEARQPLSEGPRWPGAEPAAQLPSECLFVCDPARSGKGFRGPPDLSMLCPTCSPSLPSVILCAGGNLLLGLDFLPHSILPFCQVCHLYDSGEARDIHLELEGLAHPRATPKLVRHGESWSWPLQGGDCPEQSVTTWSAPKDGGVYGSGSAPQSTSGSFWRPFHYPDWGGVVQLAFRDAAHSPAVWCTRQLPART